ncbi:hypothetical protein BLOT_000872 [Blomia tropicalis]|nr:hypothetical protein BLOT_000872 [Blomia tropicalis]
MPTDGTNNITKRKIARPQPEGLVPSNTILYDCCAYVFFCSEHGNVALSVEPIRQHRWLPYTVLPHKMAWQAAALHASYIVLAGGDTNLAIALRERSPYGQAYIMEVQRIQIGQSMRFMTRIIFFIRIDMKRIAKMPNNQEQTKTVTAKFQCCQTKNRIEWRSLESIQSGTINLVWGPEPVNYIRRINRAVPQKISEFSLRQAYCYLPRNPPRNQEEEMLVSAQITESDIQFLYKNFMEHCFPSFSMTISSFIEYMKQYGLEHKENHLIRLFQAFNTLNNGYLSFHELLLGFASIDPHTPHKSIRIRFIFRYYARNSDTIMNQKEYRRMVCDLYPTLDEKAINEKVCEFEQIVGANNGRITFDAFMRAIASHRLRGTTTLCRARRSAFMLLNRAKIECPLSSNRNSFHTLSKMVISKKTFQGTCQRCKQLHKYVICPELSILNTNGLINGKLLQNGYIPMATNISRLELFIDSSHYGPQLLSLIRQFVPNKGTCLSPKGVCQRNPTELLQMIEHLCKILLPMLDTTEGKCVEVDSPCFMIGDIHGNIEDLITMERHIWYRLPLGSNVLFLGDYVDRGRWSVECSLYVLTLKTMYPHKVTVLRGNHEVRDIQRKYSFYDECVYKYGKLAGESVFDMLNQIFDRLPIVAIVDDAIYAAHGGIPHCSQTISSISKLPLELKSERDSELFWEVLWSDPINRTQYEQICELFMINPNEQDGFVRNTKRGAAWFFSSDGAERFLTKNGLTHIVRAHEVPANGFTFHFGDMCTTIFSSSHYQNENFCAVLFASQETLRVIVIDTYSNRPSFE